MFLRQRFIQAKYSIPAAVVYSLTVAVFIHDAKYHRDIIFGDTDKSQEEEELEERHVTWEWWP